MKSALFLGSNEVAALLSLSCTVFLVGSLNAFPHLLSSYSFIPLFFCPSLFTSFGMY